LENRETVFDVRNLVKTIDVNSSNFNLIAWPGSVNQVVQNNTLLLARDTTGRHGSWGFLDGELLVISVDSLNLIKSVGSVPLAYDTSSENLASFKKAGRVSRTFHIAARTPYVHLEALGEHSRTFGDNTSEFNKSVQVNLAKISELVLNWKVLYANKDDRVDIVVVGVDLSHDVGCDLVEDGQHACRLFGHPNSQSWLFFRQVGEIYLYGLPVVLAHLLDPWLVDDLLRSVIRVIAQEMAEPFSDKLDHFRLLYPNCQRLFGV
jgi:hypothetical protein